MTRTRMFATFALFGGWGMFLAWVTSESGLRVPSTWSAILASAGDPGGESVSRRAIAGFFVGSVMGLAAYRNTTASAGKVRWGRIAWGAILGGGGVAVLAVLGQKLGAPWWCDWVGVGAVAGVMEGFVSDSRRGVIAGLFGGAIGGLFAGVLIAGLPAWAELRRWPSRTVAATAWATGGLAIGAGIALARLATCPAWLRVGTGPDAGMELLLDRRVTSIGSNARNDLCLVASPGRVIEEFHARIYRGGRGRFWIESSCNSPTFVGNNVLGGQHVLCQGDAITIGGQQIVFHANPLYPQVSIPDTLPSRASLRQGTHARSTPARSHPAATGSSVNVPETHSPDVRDHQQGRVQQNSPGSSDPSHGTRSYPNISGTVAALVKPAPREPEAARRSLDPCPGCGRRYFGSPEARFCTNCQEWF
jgi:hypothetical protein